MQKTSCLFGHKLIVASKVAKILLTAAHAIFHTALLSIPKCDKFHWVCGGLDLYWVENTNWVFSSLVFVLFLMIFPSDGAYFGTPNGVVYIPCYICMDVSVYHRVTSYTCKIDKLDWFKKYQWISSSYFYTSMIWNYLDSG